MSDIEKIKIGKHRFYFETPIYEFINTDQLDGDIFDGDVDAYNSISHYETTFSIESRRIGDQYSDYYSFYRITLTCKRNGKDILRFFVYRDDEKVVKMGQFPSMASIQFAEIGKKYDTLLSVEDLKSFKRAISLAAEGVGIGSFVYLRRIFENLVRETFEQNKKDISETKEEFSVKRMKEKITILKSWLPSQLVEMNGLYKVLSKGLHELSEQECLAYFPALKLAIELILEQKIEMDLKKKRDEAVKKQIAEIAGEVSKQ